MRARDETEREVSQGGGECPHLCIVRAFSESDKRYMKERDDAFERVRLQLERAWPKRILPSPHSSSSADEKSSGVGGNTT